MKIKFNTKGMWNSCKLTAREWSPEAIILLGIGGGIYAAVKACQATRKLDPVLEEHKTSVAEVKNAYMEDAITAEEQKEEKKELTKVYANTGVKLLKLYGPSIAIGTLSVTGILTGNRILRQRNVSLAAAYAALDSSFRGYRSRAIEKFGEEADRALRFGSEKQTVSETVTDENGNTVTVTKEAEVVPDGSPLGYARYFAYGEAENAEPNADYNNAFLRAQQELANHMLKAKGFLLLNDVYDMLGIDPSVDGMTVGWVYDKHSEEHGDNYIDFRIQEVYRKAQGGDFHEKVFLIDPNVDGPIAQHANRLGLIT